MSLVFRVAVPLSLLITVACAADPDGTEPAEAEAAAGAATVAAVGEAAVVSGWYADSSGLTATVAAVPVAEARVVATGNAQRALTAAVTAPACVAVTTDQATFVAATFTDCTGPGGRGGLTGTVRGELAFVTTPCGPAMCPTALRWTVTSELSWGDGATLAGTWTVEVPVATGAARSFDGALTATASDGQTVAAAATASWTRSADDCVALDGDASLTGSTSGALTIAGLRTCPGACPSAGTIAWTGPRATLQWSYAAGATVTITAGQRTFTLPLACTP